MLTVERSLSYLMDEYELFQAPKATRPAFLFGSAAIVEVHVVK